MLLPQHPDQPNDLSLIHCSTGPHEQASVRLFNDCAQGGEARADGMLNPSLTIAREASVMSAALSFLNDAGQSRRSGAILPQMEQIC